MTGADDHVVALVRNAPAPVSLHRVIRDAGGRIVDARIEALNDAAAALVQPLVRAPAAVGRTLRELLSAADADEVLADLAAVVGTGRSVEHTWHMTDGRVVGGADSPGARGGTGSYAVTRVPVGDDRIVSCFRDLRNDERLAREAAVASDRARRAEEALVAGLKASPEVFAIGSLESDGGIRFALLNEAGRRMVDDLADVDLHAPRLEPGNPVAAALRPFLESAHRADMAVPGRVRVAASGGNRLSIELAVAPIPDGRFVLTARDVSDVVAMEQELVEHLQLTTQARRLLHVALDSSPFGFTVYRVHRDEDGHAERFSYEFVNRAAVEADDDVRDWVGHDVQERPAAGELLRRLVAVADTGVPVRDVMTVDVDGRSRHVEMILSRVDGERVVGVRWDVTERVESGRALADARDAALAASRATADFLATITHEIRTPLTSIVGAADLLLGSRLDPSQYELVARQREAADVLVAILSDILDLSKIEAGRMQLGDVAFDVRTTWERTVALLEEPAVAKGLEFRTQFDDAVPRWLRGDPVRFRQVLLNLLSNAVKFTDAGCVCASVTVAAGASDDTAGDTDTRHGDADAAAGDAGTVPGVDGGAGCAVVVEVSDTGVGIRPEAMAALFEPFRQAETSTSRRYGGTGLGLSIVSRLVDAMGGNVVVTSEPGQGSTFRATMRLGLASPPAVRGEAGPDRGAGRSRGHPADTQPGAERSTAAGHDRGAHRDCDPRGRERGARRGDGRIPHQAGAVAPVT